MAVRWFGVRHHSPAAARLVRRLVEDERPAAVLVEGPCDFNDRIGELALDHRLPIAIYSSVVVPEAGRRAAYHPFCVYSPEWQAIRAGLEIGADVRFVDLPWAAIALEAGTANRYADGELRASPALGVLLERLGVDTFDDAWDLLVEVDPELDLATYLARVEALCGELRPSDPAHVPKEDHRREAFMAARIREVVEAVDGDVLVVTGGFHTPALRALVEEGAGGAPPGAAATPPEVPSAADGEGRTIALTPYDYASLDALTGYDAGMPNPGFYHEAWLARTGATAEPPAERALAEVVGDLRRQGRPISPADLIAARTTAGALAALRGHAEVWRRDLVDGVSSALIKDEIALGISHPVLDAVHRILRGTERGRLSDDAARPPFVLDLLERLERHGLDPESRPRVVDLALHEADGLERSRTLHAVAALGLPGFALADEHVGGDAFTERWRLRREIEFEGQAIEAAAYGTTLPDAVAARLLEEAGRAERDAAAAAELLGRAVRAGVPRVGAQLAARVAELVQGDADAGSVAGAVAALLALYRYDRVLGAAGRTDVGALLGAAYERTLWLLDPGGRDTVDEEGGTAAVGAALEAYERSGAALALDRGELQAVLERVAAAPEPPPAVRGAALGALWVLEAASEAMLLDATQRFGDPAVLGDFLHGLFTVARDVMDRRPALLTALDRLVAGYADPEFLAAVPGLRRAFAVFPPREKDHLARAIVGGRGATPAALDVDPAALERVMELEAALREALVRYGVRGAG